MAKSSVLQIGFQGRVGSFTHQALSEYMADKTSPWRAVRYNTFDEVVVAFNRRQVAEMFLGTENNNSGGVHAMTLLLPEMTGTIVGEHFLHVEQCLLVKSGSSWNDIKEVVSQRPALDQCRVEIARHGWKTLDYADTALAASHVSSSKRRDLAAIASPLAGKHYHLDNLGNLADNISNFTRFLHIAPLIKFEEYMPPYIEGGSYITTVIVDGSLLQPNNLSLIASHHIDISRLERLPNSFFLPSRFLLDFQVHKDDPNYKKCFRALSSQGLNIRSIGCYNSQPRPI